MLGARRDLAIGMKPKFIAGAAVIALALAYMMYAGVTQSAVYFLTPSELRGMATAGKVYRVGGMVEKGSLRWDARTLDLSFTLSDGLATILVRHTGTAPDLFGEGRGAVVEGRWTSEGYFKATQILAKHSEEYRAPHDPSQVRDTELLRTLKRGNR
jgi:cytochrome c-type biogenesis protein CcmE